MTPGFVLLDKPAGPTSHDAIVSVRRALDVRRVGHTGTLDPFATGLLVALVGPATRLARFCTGWRKTYTGTIRLGIVTDTDDGTGTIVSESEAPLPDDDAIERIMQSFEGTGRQRPPAYSAKQVEGRRAHRMARRGMTMDLPEHDVEIEAFRILGRAGADLSFRVTVSAGTYVRALARDVGERLGCGAHCAALRRTMVGPFSVDDAVAPDTVTAADVHPPRDLLSHLHAVLVAPADVDSIRHGRAIPAGGAAAGPVALVSDDTLLGVAESDGVTLQPRVVLP